MKPFDARLKTPFSCIITGAPLCGKTTFVKRLLEERDRLIDHPIDYIIWCYGQDTHFIQSLKTNPYGIPTTLVQELPDDFSQYIVPERRGLIVIDDLMQSASNAKSVTDLFCNKLQHTNTSVILLLQNLFYHGSERTTLVRCVHYLVIFANRMDQSVQLYLSQKLLPRHKTLFLDIFDEATNKPHGYLFYDGKQDTPDEARYRTDLFDNGIQKAIVVKLQPKTPCDKAIN